MKPLQHIFSQMSIIQISIIHVFDHLLFLRSHGYNICFNKASWDIWDISRFMRYFRYLTESKMFLFIWHCIGDICGFFFDYFRKLGQTKQNNLNTSTTMGLSHKVWMFKSLSFVAGQETGDRKLILKNCKKLSGDIIFNHF